MDPLTKSPQGNNKAEEPASHINIESDLLQVTLVLDKELKPPWSARMRVCFNKVLILMSSVMDVSLTSNPVFEILRQQELSKHILFIAMAMFNTLQSLHATAEAPPDIVISISVTLLALGVACLFTSILYKEVAVGASLLLEMLGLGQVLGAFYFLAARMLPGYYAFIPGAGYVLCLMPLVLGFWKSSPSVAVHNATNV